MDILLGILGFVIFIFFVFAIAFFSYIEGFRKGYYSAKNDIENIKRKTWLFGKILWYKCLASFEGRSFQRFFLLFLSNTNRNWEYKNFFKKRWKYKI